MASALLCFGHLQRKINFKLMVQKCLRALLNRFFTDVVSKKEAAAQPFVQRLLVYSFLQNAGADGVCHLKQVLLPDKAKLCLVAVRKADRQFRGLQRVAEARVPVTPCISTMMMRWLVNTT